MGALKRKEHAFLLPAYKKIRIAYLLTVIVRKFPKYCINIIQTRKKERLKFNW